MVKAGLLKQGFYNGSFANLRKYARGEGFVDDAVSVGRIVSRHSNRREEGIRPRSQVLGSDLLKISWTVFFFLFRDWRERQERLTDEGSA